MDAGVGVGGGGSEAQAKMRAKGDTDKAHKVWPGGEPNQAGGRVGW